MTEQRASVHPLNVQPRCDLHVHSVFSTDSGNFALRRARLGESFTPPERVYDTASRAA